MIYDMKMAVGLIATRTLRGELAQNCHCFYWQDFQQCSKKFSTTFSKRKESIIHSSDSSEKHCDPWDYFLPPLLITRVLSRRLETFSVALFCLLLASSVLPDKCDAASAFPRQQQLDRNNISTLLDNLLLDYDSRLRPGYGGRH